MGVSVLPSTRNHCHVNSSTGGRPLLSVMPLASAVSFCLTLGVPSMDSSPAAGTLTTSATVSEPAGSVWGPAWAASVTVTVSVTASVKSPSKASVTVACAWLSVSRETALTDTSAWPVTVTELVDGSSTHCDPSRTMISSAAFRFASVSVGGTVVRLATATWSVTVPVALSVLPSSLNLASFGSVNSMVSVSAPSTVASVSVVTVNVAVWSPTSMVTSWPLTAVKSAPEVAWPVSVLDTDDTLNETATSAGRSKRAVKVSVCPSVAVAPASIDSVGSALIAAVASLVRRSLLKRSSVKLTRTLMVLPMSSATS